MRSVVYGCAMSLDGYIADPGDGYDWIVQDPDIDFAAIFSRYDTFLLGRKTYEVMRRMGHMPSVPGGRTFLCSRAADPEEHPDVAVTADAERTAAELRAAPGKDIWLFGGGELFRSLLAAGLVDEVSVAVIPVLLGGGIPFLPAPASRASLRLKRHRLYEKSGIMLLDYDVLRT
jgi:dihydrofolate reductase